MARVAILNSRQSKTPMAGDRWIVQTRRAVAWAAEGGHDIVSSVGLFTWELVAWEAVRLGLTVHLVIPPIPDLERERVARDLFGRRPETESLIHWIVLDDMRSIGRSAWWESRDRRVIGSAEWLVPVSLRKDSRLHSLIREVNPGARIEGQFRIESKPESHHLKAAVESSRLNPDLRTWPEGFLIHWTRGTQGPWPGESRDDYYCALLRESESGSDYHHSGFRTLRRILREGRLRGSVWRIAGGTPVVALTECSPLESIPLMRWRPRWTRWSFEPYGIGIDRRWLSVAGGRPVRYVEEVDWKNLTPHERVWCHRRGSDTDVWPAEREWRVEGDVDFSDAPSDAFRILVRTKEEAISLQAEYPSLNVTSMTV